ncbi:hypothetical protein HanXRQr2_Chr04g0169361 [Helianthus annuus]|uniref:Uncharacterized protein n=1 Tax=Helianthus annuus TaxID=4232 RepID=A0A9K3J7S4_HELAN|nr:hypothetical protein HanXRQr2_Chr04g0169361 [Helianthus annuus]KAJ0931548.1 hypothetical protein HanPSC8_Chr04g0162971 [Helianthus annuus]
MWHGVHQSKTVPTPRNEMQVTWHGRGRTPTRKNVIFNLKIMYCLGFNLQVVFTIPEDFEGDFRHSSTIQSLSNHQSCNSRSRLKIKLRTRAANSFVIFSGARVCVRNRVNLYLHTFRLGFM